MVPPFSRISARPSGKNPKDSGWLSPAEVTNSDVNPASESGCWPIESVTVAMLETSPALSNTV